jgi:BMFP domain-containing protein YqiC
MKDYSEINLDETPIIVLGCGHFFTSESVDGLVGLDQVYTRDKDGKFEDLRDLSSSLATAIPSCPDCKQPIRQFVTKRYNRVVNRAVMDETYKRFLAKGRIDLANLESRLNDIEHKLNSKGAFLLPGNAAAKLKALDIEALKLSKTMQAENQPMKRLMDAITASQKLEQDEIASLSARMEATNLAIQEPDSKSLSAQG